LDELAVKGVRLTAQRRILIEIIQNAEQHLDAASLLELARRSEPNIDRATVYRTLELLKRFRLIDELDLMHLQGEKHYYEVKTRRDHIHLACFNCGRIEEFTSSMFDQLKTEFPSKPVSQSGSPDWRSAASVAHAQPLASYPSNRRMRKLKQR
jgi:Fur family ferric uptake transcriptional regulator